jgi:hypothetical protein
MSMIQYQEKMKSLLPKFDDCNDEQIRHIIAKYWCFVELLSFWSVMWYAYFWAKSEAGKEALIDNIDCEGKQNHQMMLNTFLEECDAVYDKKISQYMREVLKPARTILQKYANQESAFAHIVFLTLAENTSLEFIPRLAQGAQRLWCKDMTYTDVHGEADIKHAQLFEKAFYEEQAHLSVSNEETSKIIEVYFVIMERIFEQEELL